MSENAVLNANYLLSRVKHFLPVPQGDRCMHEFVATAAKLKSEKGISAMDLAKRLLDYGFHAPTVYFPLSVKESIMVEPTETESKETLDAFAETLFRIIEEDADMLHDGASHHARQPARRSPRRPPANPHVVPNHNLKSANDLAQGASAKTKKLNYRDTESTEWKEICISKSQMQNVK